MTREVMEEEERKGKEDNWSWSCCCWSSQYEIAPPSCRDSKIRE